MNQQAKVERPDFITDEHLSFLDDLRESGITNMFGAPLYLIEAFDDDDPRLTRDQATKITSYWMKTFGNPDR